ncbi:hypothetical protein SLS56_006057 [Neofusicoccum ribis]|uniref:BTB domain-containing protein n=1 Tax=Neofusicoccum ribis TaxID=45134 RepID=A0ABR3SRQ3_9PEZI
MVKCPSNFSFVPPQNINLLKRIGKRPGSSHGRPQRCQGTCSAEEATVPQLVSFGDCETKFITYFDLLCYWSPKFRELLDECPTLLELPKVNPRVFEIFLNWMLSEASDLPDWVTHNPKHEKLKAPGEVDGDEVLEDLDGYYRQQPEAEALGCYIFAHDYGIRLFMNDLFDSIHEMNPDANLVPSYSVVLMFGTDVGYREELILRKHLPASFWVPILTLRDNPHVLDDYPPWEEDLCQYHVHDEDERELCYWQNIGDAYSSDEDDEEDEEEEAGVDDEHPYGMEGIDDRSDDELSVSGDELSDSDNECQDDTDEMSEEMTDSECQDDTDEMSVEMTDSEE